MEEFQNFSAYCESCEQQSGDSGIFNGQMLCGSTGTPSKTDVSFSKAYNLKRIFGPYRA